MMDYFTLDTVVACNYERSNGYLNVQPLMIFYDYIANKGTCQSCGNKIIAPVYAVVVNDIDFQS